MKDKVVIITGGTSGIGRELAIKFARENSKVVITGRNMNSLSETKRELLSISDNVLAIKSDVSREEDNSYMVKRTLEHFGCIDILINNAGVSMSALFEDTDLDVIREVMDINFYGSVYAIKHSLPSITKRKGIIVGISSVAGSVGLPGRTGYCSSKFALEGFLESLRRELIHKGVSVIIASPGFVATNIRKSALDSQGNAKEESSIDESSIMTSRDCANRIYKAIAKKKRKSVFSIEGKLAILFNRWYPSIVDKKSHQRFKLKS